MSTCGVQTGLKPVRTPKTIQKQNQYRWYLFIVHVLVTLILITLYYINNIISLY